MIRIRRAIISCWDKTRLEEVAKVLQEHQVEILSSGGTASYLAERGIPAQRIEELTHFPEILDGRVKTLHPYIHGALLAKPTETHQTQLKELGIEPIQLAIVNLYPFVEEAVSGNLPLAEAIEYIDIGGPTILRAAAKNFQNVVALHHPDYYEEFLKIFRQHNGAVPVEFSRKMAREVFFYTSWYDARVSDYFKQQFPEGGKIPPYVSLHLKRKSELRYGENPHQAAGIYEPFQEPESGFGKLEVLWGKPMSYNNYVDVEAAYDLVMEFEDPAFVIVKHTNPCGVGVSQDSLKEAFDKAWRGDPLSAFGGIFATNRPVDAETAEKMRKIFFECLIAPDFSPEALQILQKKKNLRILKLPHSDYQKPVQKFHVMAGLSLIQSADEIVEDPTSWKSVTGEAATEKYLKDLMFAWKVVKHVKSNAIVIVKDEAVYGIGAGQMSRVDSVKIAIEKARANNRDLNGTVLASDAFFPFRDSVDIAAEAGIKAIIQPGGSIRDEEVIQAAREHQMTMVFTGIRHFKH